MLLEFHAAVFFNKKNGKYDESLQSHVTVTTINFCFPFNIFRLGSGGQIEKEKEMGEASKYKSQ